MKRATLLSMLLFVCFCWQGHAQTNAYGINNATLELVSFDITNPGTLTVIGSSAITVNYENAGAIDPANPGTAYVLEDIGTFYSVDIATGTYTSLGNIAPTGNETWTGMEFDPITGDLYAISSDGTTSTLFSIDITAVTATNIGVTGMALAISLAIDDQGNIYAHDIGDDNLYIVDKTTGVSTIVGPTGFDANYGQGMCWDYNTDTVYMAAFNNDSFQAEWRSVNTASGATTLIGALGTPGTDQVSWVSTPGALVVPPTCPDPLNLNVTNITATSVDMSWDPVTNASSGYEWFIYAAGADPAVDTPIASATVPSGITTASETGLTPDTPYDFYVTANCDTDGMSNLVGPIAFSTTPTCPQPTNLTPANITTTSVDFSWDPVTNATNGYEWYVFADGADPITDTPVDMGTTASGTTTVSVGALTPNTSYDFYLIADCGTTDGISSLAGPISFTTLAPPPPNDNLVDAIPLTLNTVCSGDAYTNLGATIQAGEPAGSCHFLDDTALSTVWFTFVAPADGNATVSTDIVPGALSDSQLTIFEAPTDVNDLTTLGAEVGCDEDSGTTIGLMSIAQLSGLVPGNTYYIQVDGYGTNVGSFCIEVTGTLSVSDQMFEGFSFFPNPANNKLSLKANSEIEQVTLYDLLGQEVLTNQPNSLNSVLNLENLQTGAYIMKVSINGEEGVYRLIKE